MLSQELNTPCCFCSKSISKGAPLMSINIKRNSTTNHVTIQRCQCESHHTFCDIICAKLYNDNISPIDIDVANYNKSVANGLVGKKAETIYTKTNGTLFKMLPTYKPDDPDIRDDVSLMKKKYRAILSHIKFD